MTAKIGYEGTCPVCFRTQSVTGERMVLHGYKRPGDGEVIGQCFGVGERAFELSTEGTVKWIAVLAAQIATAASRCDALKSGAIDSLTDKVWCSRNDPDPVAARLGFKRVEVKRGEPKFATLLAQAIADVEGVLSALTRERVECQRRVDAWVLGALVPYNIQQRQREAKEAVAARKAAKKEANEAARVAHKLGLVWESVKHAIEDHAREHEVSPEYRRAAWMRADVAAGKYTMIGDFETVYGKTAKQFAAARAKARKGKRS